MKISVKQGRLMAFMVAMVLIVGIFIIGKMLGYGSAKNLYLLEGYGDVVEGNTDDDGDDAQGDDKDDEEEIGNEPFKENKGEEDGEEKKEKKEKKEVKDPEPRMSNSNGLLITQKKEEFTCGKNKLLTSSVSGYDESESKLTPF